MSNEMVVLQDVRLDPDQFLLEKVDVTKGPKFTVSQFGMIFFARSPYWVRWLEDEHKNVLGGDPDCTHVKAVDGVNESLIVDGVCSNCGGHQVGMRKTGTGYRTYNLAEVEQFIHALLTNKAINGAQAINALHLVQTMAKIHGLIP